ncbi:MAG TPA: DUF2231 domain-containing protein [Vicinamibacterales bacterium]|nr:DUF2231 domain-containing protein [Vicinamibacterales bacterium]
MKSFASVKGHPIHPALIPFPFAFLLGALFFDVLGALTHRASLSLTGYHLNIIGLIAGIVTAVPGILDYARSVPPHSSGHRRARSHGLANGSALILFAVALGLRESGIASDPAIGLEVLGGIALVYAGWIGGTLVTRNLISVDHRYAEAGRWQETTVTTSGHEPVVVARVGDLQDDQMKLLIVNGRRVVLARTGGAFTAFDDGCTHRGGSLADGVCIGRTVQCLWHGSQFDVVTGEVRCGPAKKQIRVYPVTQRDGEVLLVV